DVERVQAGVDVDGVVGGPDVAGVVGERAGDGVRPVAGDVRAEVAGAAAARHDGERGGAVLAGDAGRVGSARGVALLEQQRDGRGRPPVPAVAPGCPV